MGYGILMSSGGGSGASSSDTTAVAANVLTGKKYVGSDTNDGVGTGTMPSASGGTYNPTTATKTLVSGGRYVSSDVKVNGFSLPAAANLKKGYTYTPYSGLSVTGTFEGYTTSPYNIYSSSKWTSPYGYVKISGEFLTYGFGLMGISGVGNSLARLNNTFNLSAYKYIKVDCGFNLDTEGKTKTLTIGISTSANLTSVSSCSSKQARSVTTSMTTQVVLDVSSITTAQFIYFNFYGGAYDSCSISKISVTNS